MKSLRGFTALMVLGFLLCVPGITQDIPSPEEILGFPVGADYHLATYTQAVEYFHALESASDRIRLFDMGQTSMGQTMTYAVISSQSNLSQLDKFKDMERRLSLAENLTPEEAEAMSREGKAVVYIDGGLHASECAPAQHNIQLAYDLATAQDAKTLRILDDVILILVFANPDGMNMLAEWYHGNLGTPYEVSPLPRLYHIYAGHDNNRDSYLANLVETRNISRLLHKEWFPVILYNHHQTAPFPARIWTPPNSEPTNPNIHPLVVRWQNMIGSAMGAAFDAENKEGAISRIIFDTWYPGYVTQAVDSHNIISILTETALYRYATPHFYTLNDFPKQYQDLTMSAFYPNPWKGGWWRLKDAVDYCLTASKSVLDIASKYRQEMLLNKYRMARDVIERFRNEPPYAWIVPDRQLDPSASALLLSRMHLLGIDVYRSNESFTSDGISYPEGTTILPVSQPFGLFLKNVFEEQAYPDLRQYPQLWQGLIRPKTFEGAPLESYDMMGWTLPYQFGLETHVANTPIDVPMTRLETFDVPSGRISGGSGYGYAFSPRENASYSVVNDVFKAGGKVFRSKKAFSIADHTFSPGTLIVPSREISRSLIQRLAGENGVNINGLPRKPDTELASLKPTRLGMYQSWISSAEEGWTRLVLDNHHFTYKSLHDADVRAGDLKNNFDAIIIPHARRTESLVDGHTKGTMPPAYVGGLTAQGVRNLKNFVTNGGTLIFINGSCSMALKHFDLPVRSVLENAGKEDFICTGSLLRMDFDNTHPVAYGMPKQAPAVFSGSFAFQIMPSFISKKEPVSVARYAANNLLMSGWMYGGKAIRQKSSILDVPLGKGRIILLGFPIQFRGQPYATFKLLFNSIFYAGSQ